MHVRRPRMVLLVAGLLVSGCAQAGGGSGPPRQEERADEPRILGDWVLVAGTVDGLPFPFPPAGTAGTLAVDEAYMGGRFFCNGIGGPYRLDGDRLELGEVGSTLVSCNEELMRAESAYYRVFSADDTRVSRRGGEMVFSNDVGELHFRHRPVPPAAGQGSSPGADV
jgi:heat shock protein HslJ